jgi:hypothetical protein
VGNVKLGEEATGNRAAWPHGETGRPAPFFEEGYPRDKETDVYILQPHNLPENAFTVSTKSAESSAIWLYLRWRSSLCLSKGESPSTLPVQTNISDGRPESGMQKILAAIAVGLALNLPSTIFGQSTEPPVHPRHLMALRIGGAVRNGGLFHVDPTMTISEALAMAGGPARQGQGARCGCSGMGRSSRPSLWGVP